MSTSEDLEISKERMYLEMTMDSLLISSSWSPLLKAYHYEAHCNRRNKSSFEKLGVEYEHNPTDSYSEWLREHWKNKFDAIITLPNGKKITLDFKHRSITVKVTHKWLLKDWTSGCDIFVTDNPQAVSYQDKRFLEARHQRLLTETQLVVYIGRIVATLRRLTNITSKNRVIYFIILTTEKARKLIYKILDHKNNFSFRKSVFSKNDSLDVRLFTLRTPTVGEISSRTLTRRRF